QADATLPDGRMRLLIARLEPYKTAVAMTLVLATVTQLLVLTEPQLLRLMIDRYVMRAASLTPGQFFGGVAMLVGAAVIVLTVARVARSVQESSIQTVARLAGDLQHLADRLPCTARMTIIVAHRLSTVVHADRI